MSSVRRRGSALINSMSVLMAVFITGSGVLALSIQSMNRGRNDALRQRALACADAGVEKAIHYLRTIAPDGSKTGSWRPSWWAEWVRSPREWYGFNLVDGVGDNTGKILVTSWGSALDGSPWWVGNGPSARPMYQYRQRGVRVALVLDREDISIWNNVIFGGVGQGGRSIQGNVRIMGSVHLLGDGEPFTDIDSDQRWDDNESYTDSNGNGQYDIGEPFADADGDGRRDSREPFNDINGNGYRDPALTVTDLASDFGGSALVGNHYGYMPSSLKSLVPPLGTRPFRGELVETLRAKMRVKHGRVDISGTAGVGEPNVSGGSPPRKETMDGSYVSDGYGGNQGASQVYSDNGYRQKYNLGNMVTFPVLTDPVVVNGVSYASYMNYLEAVGMVINGNLTIKPGQTYGPIADTKGNAFQITSSGQINITGIVFVKGDIKFDKNGGNRVITYSGRGTMVSTNNIEFDTDLYPVGPYFPMNHAIGLIARRKMKLGQGGGASHLTMAGAFYAQEEVISAKQNEIAGTFVSSYYSMTNVPRIYQVPSLPDYLPPGMPGAGRLWIKSVRVDSWREL